MAISPKAKQAKAKASPADDDPLKDEALARLDAARDQKNQSIADIEECYYFAAPRRVRQASSDSYAETKPTDADELCTSLGFEVAEDFMTMLIDSFMPQSGRWAERKADPFLPNGVRMKIEKDAKLQDEALFEVIRGSNFHAELAKQGVPDGAIGVLAMTIEDPGRGQPPRCIGVAIRELEMNLGPDGRIDDRFIVRMHCYRDLPVRLKGIELPKEIAKKVEEEPDEEVEVVWGYWRDWDSTDEAWQHVVLVGGERVHDAKLTGSGCCPLVIGRFGATPDFAWPDGPMIKALPDLRQIDETDAAFIENLDFTLRPPFAYDDDGVLNFEGGVESGMGYPRRPKMGAGDTFEKIWEPNPIDAAMFQHDAKQRRVRRLHYVDFPEQVGKTPPTLGQWLDEMVEAQKKIGTPGYAFWREFPFESFNRFRYIAETRGHIPPIEVGGVKVALTAYNPAQRAQENQEVLTATRLGQIGTSLFPQTWQVAVDDVKTLGNIKAKLGDKLIEMRAPEDLADAATLVASLGGVSAAMKGGGGGASGAPAVPQ